MCKYKAILFDLDGTLLNTYPGIFAAYKYVSNQMNLMPVTENVMQGVIGSAVLDIFQSKFCLAYDQAQVATQLYRTWYATHAMDLASTYEGMEELLMMLQQKHFLLATATMKQEEVAQKILTVHGLNQYMNKICGVVPGRTTKAATIEHVLKELQVDKSNALLIGDSKSDAIGAVQAGIDFMAVTYGFGFEQKTDADIFHPVFTANSTTDIASFFGV